MVNSLGIWHLLCLTYSELTSLFSWGVFVLMLSSKTAIPSVGLMLLLSWLFLVHLLEFCLSARPGGMREAIKGDGNIDGLEVCDHSNAVANTTYDPPFYTLRTQRPTNRKLHPRAVMQ